MTQPTKPAPQRTVSTAGILLAGGLAVLAATVLSVGVGSTSISPLEVVRSLLAACGLIDKGAVELSVYTSVVAIRMPRVLCGLLAGMGLSLSGAVMQGVFRNPLADPGLLGVSAGGGFGALMALTLGVSSMIALPGMAFLGAMAAVALILAVAAAAGRGGGRVNTVTLVMSGMAISALFSAATSLALSVSNEYQVNAYIFWTMGGLSNRRWEHVGAVAAPVLACCIVILLLASRLDLLLLGDEQARALGVRAGRTRLVFILLASLCTACIVCVTGPIGFVGLMVPHMMRMLVGPSHRKLCLASALGGGVFLVLCDTLVRWLSGFKGREFSVGIITALIGAPYFLFLLCSKKNRNSF